MKKPNLLNAIIILLVLNAVIAFVHYMLIFAGVMPAGDDLVIIKEFAVADFFATIIPSIAGAFGLWCLKAWGWLLAMLANGAYLHGLLALLTRSALTSNFNAMSVVSIYFILFSLGVVAYLWRHRKLFSW